MIVIDDILISDFLSEESFCCDLQKCKGNCCVLGDSGPPLEAEEVGIIEDLMDDIKPYMRKEGLEVIEKHGVIEYDDDGNFVAPLVNNEECAFAYFENDIALCAIEKAWQNGKIHFQKPVSCHLYPIRISHFNNRDAVNYHHWEICDAARKLGRKNKIPLYRFTKDALMRKYGKEWYEKLVKSIEKNSA